MLQMVHMKHWLLPYKMLLCLHFSSFIKRAESMPNDLSQLKLFSWIQYTWSNLKSGPMMLSKLSSWASWGFSFSFLWGGVLVSYIVYPVLHPLLLKRIKNKKKWVFLTINPISIFLIRRMKEMWQCKNPPIHGAVINIPWNRCICELDITVMILCAVFMHAA